MKRTGHHVHTFLPKLSLIYKSWPKKLLMKLITERKGNDGNSSSIYIYKIAKYTGCSQKNWTVGFLPFMVFPVTCEHFRGNLNIRGG